MANINILITGATGAIGSALARAYAAPGVTLHLHGRNSSVLEQLSSECQVLGAQAYVYSCNLLCPTSVADLLHQIDDKGHLGVFIANAGMNINTGDDLAGEKLDEMEALLDLNVKATLMMTNQVAERMRNSQSGQIALVSSLAGFFGLPVTPSYCASKAAVKAYGEALRGSLRAAGVGVTVVMPGYVESKMCREMPGPKPFLWSADKAAKVIKKSVTANRARVSFPFPLNVGCWCLAILPAAFSGWVVRLLGYNGK